MDFKEAADNPQVWNLPPPLLSSVEI